VGKENSYSVIKDLYIFYFVWHLYGINFPIYADIFVEKWKMKA
jgi:hypothetical protein